MLLAAFLLYALYFGIAIAVLLAAVGFGLIAVSVANHKQANTIGSAADA